jgi:hypothetical protein
MRRSALLLASSLCALVASGAFGITQLWGQAPRYGSTRDTSAELAPETAFKNGLDIVYGPGDKFEDPDCSEGCGDDSELLDGCEGEEIDGECLDCMACLGPRWSAGFQFTFVKPHFDTNPAFTIMESDGDTFESFTEIDFDYDTELTPRVWIEVLQCESLGLRVSYWQFDNSAATASASPPANGFGRIIPPTFGDVDLSTSIPNSMYTANTSLNAYNVDIEATHSFDCGAWGWLAGAGLRFADISQSYVSQLVDPQGNTQGTIDFGHRVQGIGPILSARTQRPFTPQFALFGIARGALLFGDSDSSLMAVEDQDLDSELTTSQVTMRDDLLPIGELQVGLQWTPPCVCGWYPYLHLAMEGQVWPGAGNASSEEGSVGFYGFNVALGVDW